MSTARRDAERPAASDKQIYQKHSLTTRVLHWANFIVIAALVWTAFLLLSGTPELPYSHWLSPGFYSALHLDNRNDEGRVWHVLLSFIMIAVGAIYVVYLGVSRRWKTMVPNAASWKDAYLVVLNDLGIRRHAPTLKKYNGAQRIAYTGVVLLGVGEVVTGLPIYFKDWTAFANVLGGQDAIRAEHFAFMLGILAFVVVHLVQVTRAGWNNFRSMVIGIEVLPSAAEGSTKRVNIEQAVPEPERVLSSLSPGTVEETVRTKSRGSIFAFAIVSVAALSFIGFAHQQSAARAGVPVWMDWARDTAGAEAAPNGAKPTDSDRKSPDAERDAAGASK